MSIIADLQTYIKTYTELSEGAPVWVDFLGPINTEYSIVPLAGDKILAVYINGDSLRTYPFAFRSVESTMSQLEKLENYGFYETFAEWLEERTYSGNLPTLDAGKTATEIYVTGWSYLVEEGGSQTGIYQVQCALEYEQDEIIT